VPNPTTTAAPGATRLRHQHEEKHRTQIERGDPAGIVLSPREPLDRRHAEASEGMSNVAGQGATCRDMSSVPGSMLRGVSRIAVAGGLILLCALAPSPAAQASQRTAVTHNCLHVAVKPRKIIFACGDGNYWVNQLDWQRWRLARGVGRGVFHQNDCLPSCAEGSFHSAEGKLVLEDRLWCSDIGRYVFRRAHVRYEGTLLGRRRTSFRLFCPL
jgi:hypothetical protein